MSERDWFKEFPGAITICDPQGIILDMNDQAAILFEGDGGRGLTGSNLLDCHPSPAREKLQKMMESQNENIYTIEKKGVKKLIYQTPWYREGKYCGFMELSFEIPPELPHFVR